MIKVWYMKGVNIAAKAKLHDIKQFLLLSYYLWDENFNYYQACIKWLTFFSKHLGLILCQPRPDKTGFYSLQSDKKLGQSKLKGSADDKTNMSKKLKFDLWRVENIVGKGENAPFPTMFSIGFFFRVIKTRDCLVRRLRNFPMHFTKKAMTWFGNIYRPKIRTNLSMGESNAIVSAYWFDLIISVYLSSLPVAHLSDAPRRRLVVTGDSARIQDETTENSAWFFNVLGV